MCVMCPDAVPDADPTQLWNSAASRGKVNQPPANPCCLPGKSALLKEPDSFVIVTVEQLIYIQCSTAASTQMAKYLENYDFYDFILSF